MAQRTRQAMGSTRLRLPAIAVGLLAALSPASVGAEPSPALTRQTFTYKTVADVQVQADVYRADDRVVRPVLVWIHGGALIFGRRTDVPDRLIEASYADGYVLVSIDYRLAPEVKLPEIMEDVLDALQWVRQEGPALFAADPERLVVAGESAGGYLTLMCGVWAKPRPTALLTYYGYGTIDGPWYAQPSEFYRSRFPLIEPDDARSAVGQGIVTGAGIAEGRGKFYLYLRQNGLWPTAITGLSPSERSRFDPFCPARNVAADFPPTLLIHGTADTDVPYEESANMAAALADRQVSHTLITLEGSGHGLTDGDPGKVAEAHAQARKFIARHLCLVVKTAKP
jgi:acetyl esterase/lipase